MLVPPVGVPANESGSSLKDGTCEWGEGVAAADDSIEGGVPTEFVGFGCDGFVRVVFGGVALLGLMVGEDVEDNGPPGTTADAGLLLLAGSDEAGADCVLLMLLFSDGLWDWAAALVTETVVATELVAAATATDDSPEIAVAAVVSANEGDCGE